MSRFRSLFFVWGADHSVLCSIQVVQVGTVESFVFTVSKQVERYMTSIVNFQLNHLSNHGMTHQHIKFLEFAGYNTRAHSYCLCAIVDWAKRMKTKRIEGGPVWSTQVMCNKEVT